MGPDIAGARGRDETVPRCIVYRAYIRLGQKICVWLRGERCRESSSAYLHPEERVALRRVDYRTDTL